MRFVLVELKTGAHAAAIAPQGDPGGVGVKWGCREGTSTISIAQWGCKAAKTALTEKKIHICAHNKCLGSWPATADCSTQIWQTGAHLQLYN